MTGEFTIHLTDKYVEINEETVSGEKKHKFIDYPTLTSIFQVEQRESGLKETPWLPGEYGIQRMVENNRYLGVLYLEPPRRRQLVYAMHAKPEFSPDYYSDYEWGVTRSDFQSDEEHIAHLKELFDKKVEDERSDGMYMNRFNVLTPSMLFSLQFIKNSGYKLNTSKVYTMKTPIFTGEEALFKAPYSNIFNNDAVCWGNSNGNRLNVPTMKAIQGIPHFFFQAPFNSDLDEGRFSPHTSKLGEYSIAHTHVLLSDTEKLLNEQSEEDVMNYLHSHLRRTRQTPNDLFQSLKQSM